MNTAATIETLFLKYGHYIEHQDVPACKEWVWHLNQQLEAIPNANVCLELSPRNCAKFTLQRNDLLIIITKLFDFLDDTTVIFSIFQNRELLVADSMNVADLIAAITCM